MIHSRFLDRSERTFGSGEERLISEPEFSARVAQLPIAGWNTERGHLMAFRFVFTIGPDDLVRAA